MAKPNLSNIKVDLPTPAAEVEPRSMAEIQAEFTQMCAKAGHCQYNIVSYQKDLALLNERLRDLNLEAAASQVKEAKNE